MGQLILGVFKLRDINCQGENVSYIVFCQPKFVSFSAHYDVDILQKIDNKEFYRVSTMGYVLHKSTNWKLKFVSPNDPYKCRAMLFNKYIISNVKTNFL